MKTIDGLFLMSILMERRKDGRKRISQPVQIGRSMPDTINSILYNRYLLLIIFLFCLLCQAPMCIKETVILLFTMAGACLIVFLVPGLFVLFPGILCGIASHLIEPGLKRLLLLINPVLYSQNCGILLSDRIRSSPRMPCRQMLR